jgi:hypothetical protein
MTIMLANKTLRVPMGIIRNVPISIGPYKYPINFVVNDMTVDSHCPIIFVRPFLNTSGANIGYRKETISLKFGEEVMHFQFSKFEHKPVIKIFEEEEPEEESNLTSLVVDLYDTPEDEIERTFVENDDVIRDIYKEEIDEYLD